MDKDHFVMINGVNSLRRHNAFKHLCLKHKLSRRKETIQMRKRKLIKLKANKQKTDRKTMEPKAGSVRSI